MVFADVSDLPVGIEAIKSPISKSNPNDNSHLTTDGTVETLIVAAVVGVIFVILFEKYRFYKQIYLKRLQNRFRVIFESFSLSFRLFILFSQLISCS
jgi:hypothetical protein